MNEQDEQVFVTEAERAACQLLARYGDQATLDIRDHAERVVENPQFQDLLATGLHPSSGGDGEGFDYDQIEDEARRTFHRLMDEAVANLASSIVHYRRRGRPIGGQWRDVEETSISKMGVQTGLAEEIVQFHEAVQDAEAWRQRF